MSNLKHEIFLLCILLCLFFSCPFVFSQLSSTQKSTMITLSEKIDGSSIQWNFTKEPCSWKGVKCDPSSSTVLGISLSGFFLSSSDFLPVVCEIKTLQEFDVSNNRLNKIPEEFMEGCGDIGGLRLLNFSRNRLVGSLPKFAGFVRLELLDLSYNELNGDINSELEGLVDLKSLNLSSNLFSGSIPTQLGKSKVLKELALSTNNFQGTIPEEIMEYQNLTVIDLSQNKLLGTIPDRIRELSKLEVLILSHNNFEGPIPKTLAGLSALEVLDLSNNNFSGEIPAFLAQLGSLTWLLLSNNHLAGVIPEFRSWVTVEASGNKDLINALKLRPPSKSEKGNSVAVIVLAVTIPLVSLLVGTCIAIFLLWHCDRVNPPPGNLLTENDNHRSNIDFIKAMKAVAHKSNIVLITKFSTYYKAIMPSGSSYFIKRLNRSDKLFQLACRERFRNELDIFGRLRNPSVMTPLAYVLTASKALLLYEFAPKGTLFDALHESSGTDMDWVSRYSVAVGVAQGLAFLHGIASGPILLLDLSTKTIFLKSLKEPLIGDIELYTVIDPSKRTGSLTTVAGSVGYIPPEYAYTMRITMAANVYSFGVVLLELLTGKPPVSEGTELGKWALTNSVQQDDWDQILDSTISRSSTSVTSQMLAVLKVALGCVRESPKERPAINDILQTLQNA